MLVMATKFMQWLAWLQDVFVPSELIVDDSRCRHDQPGPWKSLWCCGLFNWACYLRIKSRLIHGCNVWREQDAVDLDYIKVDTILELSGEMFIAKVLSATLSVSLGHLGTSVVEGLSPFSSFLSVFNWKTQQYFFSAARFRRRQVCRLTNDGLF